MEAGDHGVGVPVADDDCGPGLGVGPVEGVIMVVDPRPGVLLGGPASAGDPVEVAGEVLGEPQQEGFRRTDAVPGEGEDRVLLRVGGHHVAVVAGQVRGGEVAPQLRGDVQVLDLVPGVSRVIRTTRFSALPYWLWVSTTSLMIMTSLSVGLCVVCRRSPTAAAADQDPR